MPAVGMNLKLINASRTGEITGPVNVSNKTKIKEVRKTELPSLNQEGLSITFVFYVDYKQEEKSMATIEIEGDVFFLGEEEKGIMESWEKNKKIPDEINIDVLNLVLRKCLTKSLVLAEDLQLPPPMAIPYATKKHAADAEKKAA